MTAEKGEHNVRPIWINLTRLIADKELAMVRSAHA